MVLPQQRGPQLSFKESLAGLLAIPPLDNSGRVHSRVKFAVLLWFLAVQQHPLDSTRRPLNVGNTLKYGRKPTASHGKWRLRACCEVF